jgi:hypothetical protein
MTKMRVGTWRNDSTDPMEVVSGPVGKEHVHYQAPPAKTDCWMALPKYAKLATCSQDTALRDIVPLVELGILVRKSGRGEVIECPVCDLRY